MNATTRAGTGRPIANMILTITALFIYGAVLSSLNQTLNLSNRHAFWLLFVIGVALCGLGPLGQGEHFGWWNLRHLLGYLFGILALLLGAAVLFDFALLGIQTPRTAVLALGLLMAVKMGVACFYPRTSRARVIERRNRV